MHSRQDLIIATIRTAVPAAVAWLLAQLVAAVPLVALWLSWLDDQIAEAGITGVSIEKLLSAAAVGLVCAAYYYLVRLAGRRWPIIERYLLGSAKKPVGYVLPAEVKDPA
jgi:hypothetical protein